MTFYKKDLILSVINNKPLRPGKISDEEFLTRFLKDGESLDEEIFRGLNYSLRNKDAVSLELNLYLGFHFGFSVKNKDALASLLQEEWHEKHEDVLRALLALKVNDIKVVEAIYNCAITEFYYLSDDREDGIFTLASDCIYALAKIGTSDAVQKLKLLSDSKWGEIAEKAFNVMRDYNLQ